MHESEVLLVELKDGVARVTLNRPHALNALSRQLRAALVEVFTRLRTEPTVGVVILTGAGRSFCAGLDLKELASADPTTTRSAVSSEDVVSAIERCEKPVIGAINGFAITGGFELALACDILVASTEARFADTHARVGIMPGWGLSQKLPRLIGLYRAKELSLTGNFLDAKTAYEWGLVNHVVAPEELLPTCERLARDILSCDRELVLAYKQLIDNGFSLSYSEARALEREQSHAFEKRLTPEQIEKRRLALQIRGRAQAS